MEVGPNFLGQCVTRRELAEFRGGHRPVRCVPELAEPSPILGRCDLLQPHDIGIADPGLEVPQSVRPGQIEIVVEELSECGRLPLQCLQCGRLTAATDRLQTGRPRGAKEARSIGRALEIFVDGPRLVAKSSKLRLRAGKERLGDLVGITLANLLAQCPAQTLHRPKDKGDGFAAPKMMERGRGAVAKWPVVADVIKDGP